VTEGCLPLCPLTASNAACTSLVLISVFGLSVYIRTPINAVAGTSSLRYANNAPMARLQHLLHPHQPHYKRTFQNRRSPPLAAVSNRSKGSPVVFDRHVFALDIAPLFRNLDAEEVPKGRAPRAHRTRCKPSTINHER
jgi:hypothetical protein